MICVGAGQGGELLLYYQPQVDINTGRIIGVECPCALEASGQGYGLSGWSLYRLHEETGLIVPPLADGTSLTALAQNKAQQEDGLAHKDVG